MKTIQNTNEQSFQIVNTAPQIARQQQKENDKQYINNVQYNKPVEYCFIGQENHKSYCSEISEGQQCMSGEVFPTMDMCINPRLRVS
jgi:spore germination protein GerM